MDLRTEGTSPARPDPCRTDKGLLVHTESRPGRGERRSQGTRLGTLGPRWTGDPVPSPVSSPEPAPSPRVDTSRTVDGGQHEVSAPTPYREGPSTLREVTGIVVPPGTLLHTETVVTDEPPETPVLLPTADVRDVPALTRGSGGPSPLLPRPSLDGSDRWDRYGRQASPSRRGVTQRTTSPRWTQNDGSPSGRHGATIDWGCHGVNPLFEYLVETPPVTTRHVQGGAGVTVLPESPDEGPSQSGYVPNPEDSYWVREDRSQRRGQCTRPPDSTRESNP